MKSTPSGDSLFLVYINCYCSNQSLRTIVCDLFIGDDKYFKKNFFTHQTLLFWICAFSCVWKLQEKKINICEDFWSIGAVCCTWCEEGRKERWGLGVDNDVEGVGHCLLKERILHLHCLRCYRHLHLLHCLCCRCHRCCFCSWWCIQLSWEVSWQIQLAPEVASRISWIPVAWIVEEWFTLLGGARDGLSIRPVYIRKTKRGKRKSNHFSRFFSLVILPFLTI